MSTFDTPCSDPAVSGHEMDNLEMICCHALTPKSEINNVFSQILQNTEIILVCSFNTLLHSLFLDHDIIFYFIQH